jgi:hydroxymethylpyrimidine pyrophosphatase-like HAD family hydrolase
MKTWFLLLFICASFAAEWREPIDQIVTLEHCAQKYGLPDLIVFDIDNTLIESARQIALDPSTNGFLRKKFPDNSEEVIRAIQSIVPWKLCEDGADEVVRYFQEKNVKLIAVTKRSAEIKESVYTQLMDNGIDLSRSSLISDGVLVDGSTYYKGVLHAASDKGSSLKSLLQKLNWDWQDRVIYFVDDRKSHLEAYHQSFESGARIWLFEYTYSHGVVA